MGGACSLGAECRDIAGRSSTRSAERKTPKFDDPDEQLVYDFCRDYYENHRVDDATYDRLIKRWGEKGIVDLAGLIGYYSFVSVTLNVFEVPTPPGAKLLER